MSQPPIRSSQISPDSGTSFPVSPTTGNEFLLTADITVGSPLVATHLDGWYIYNGTDWISRPKSSAANWGWNDYMWTGLEISGPNSPPSLDVFRDGIRAWAFDSGSVEQGWSYIHVLHDYVPGTDLYPHVHWSHNNATPGSTFVRWVFEYSIARGYELDTFAASTSLTIDGNAGVQYAHHIT